MNEHVHEWGIWDELPAVRCTICDEPMTEEEAERRLNATEKLSAKVANRIHFSDYDDGLDSNIDEDYLALRAYADTLEGEP